MAFRYPDLLADEKALRAARSIDGSPPRMDSDAKCAPCGFAERCGVRTRSLRSLQIEPGGIAIP